jgi:deazaflavin-dependent oxidoreductase (nitroreductase family)
MPRRYHLTATRRLANALMKPLTRFGLAGRHTYLLTVQGRTTGHSYSTPVTLVEGDERWLVAPYGEVSWVKNARAAGHVTVSRAGRTETLEIEEVGAEEAAPVLREYLGKVGITRPFFDATPDASLDTFRAEASSHPVFRLRH